MREDSILLEPVPFGYCHCRCGLRAPIAPQTHRRLGWVKAEPIHFINGHHARRQDLRADFFALVDKNGPIIRHELGPCWLWLGSRYRNGYGRISVNGRRRLAHHVALEFEGYYMIPEAFGKLQVGHLCDTRECVRVSHLKIWTAQDDADDKVSKGRQARVRGERIGSARLDQAKVEEIRSLFAAGDITGMALSRRFGVSRRNIGYIVRRVTWKHIA